MIRILISILIRIAVLIIVTIIMISLMEPKQPGPSSGGRPFEDSRRWASASEFSKSKGSGVGVI